MQAAGDSAAGKVPLPIAHALCSRHLIVEHAEGLQPICRAKVSGTLRSSVLHVLESLARADLAAAAFVGGDVDSTGLLFGSHAARFRL